MTNSLRKFTSFHNTSFANPFLQHLPDPLGIPDTKGSIFMTILLIFTSFSHLIFTFFMISSYSNEKGFRCIFCQMQQKDNNTALIQICFQKANLPICSVAIETKVLVALVEHVSASVLEINNLRYGLCQAGAWGASDCYSYVCVNLTMLKSWTVE